MAFYRQVGEVPPTRHTQFRRPDGGLYSEELVGEEGFSSDSALLYHRGVPSAIVAARSWQLPDQGLTPNAPLVPRHLRLHDLRHQYASFLVNSGRSLYEVQKILGHSSHSVTERYAHLSSKSLMDAANSASVMIREAMHRAA